MAVIRAIVSEELKESVQSQINKIKQNSRGGTEVNLSTVIRYSLEKYIEEQEKLDREVITLDFDLNNISYKQLKELEEVTEKLANIFSSGYEDTIDLVKNCFKLNQAVKYNLYKKKEVELTEEEKEILDKYKLNKEVGNE